MKKLLFFFFMVAFLANLMGQGYIPFPLDSATWSVSNMKFSTNGDTIINTKTYQKYYIQTDTVVFNFYLSNANYVASLREENKQLFMIPKDSVNEYLIYDFNKGIGDTIISYSLPFLPFSRYLLNSESIIESIDSIVINNQYRKRYCFKSTSTIPMIPKEYWIEGFGSTIGLFFTGYYNHNWADVPLRELLCFEYKKQVLYQTNVRCFYYPTTDIADFNISNSIRISPNPFSFSTEIIIDGNIDKNKGYSIFLYSSRGEIVKKEDFQNSDRIIINRENLISGLYLCVILDNNKHILSKQKLLIF